jgi:hypothetical protein
LASATNIERETPRDLDVGLVEARERAARARRLELGEGVPRSAGLQPEHTFGCPAADRTAIVDAQGNVAGGKRGRRAKRDHPGRRRHRLEHRPARRGHRDRRAERQVLRIQPDHAGRRRQLAIDLDVPGELRLRRDDRDPHGIRGRHERARQPEPGRGV